MKTEHCSGGGSKRYFVTGNYKIRTCPADEWAITVCYEIHLADRGHSRRLVTIEQCMEEEIVKLAKLQRCEVISTVLYTGPMVS